MLLSALVFAFWVAAMSDAPMPADAADGHAARRRRPFSAAEFAALKRELHLLPRAEAERRFAEGEPLQQPPAHQHKIDHFVVLFMVRLAPPNGESRGRGFSALKGTCGCRKTGRSTTWWAASLGTSRGWTGSLPAAGGCLSIRIISRRAG